MGELGSIFEAGEEAGAGRPRGQDLYVTVEVPRSALGAAQGYAADIPASIEHEGESVSRAPASDGEPGVRLFLPETLPEGAVLRLRGQGGLHPEGVAGDLMVRVRVVEPPARPLWIQVMLILLAVAFAVTMALAVT